MQQNERGYNSEEIKPLLASHFESIKQRFSRRVLEDNSDVTQSQVEQSGRRVYIVRHAERVDFTFGSWIPYSFNDAGVYVKKDLNMPKSLPPRDPNLWKDDSPVTNLGCYQALLTGEAMKEAGVRIDHVFSSPSFRCIQTAGTILEGLGLRESHPIKIEPGLFEWLAWYPAGVPNWMSNDELTSAGYNIASNYTPLTSVEDLRECPDEDALDYYKRNSELIKRLLKATDGDILLVAHAATLDTCTRPLIHSEIPPLKDLMKKLIQTAYCSMVTMESIDGGWKMVKPPCPSFTNTKNDRFDWNKF